MSLKSELAPGMHHLDFEQIKAGSIGIGFCVCFYFAIKLGLVAQI